LLCRLEQRSPTADRRSPLSAVLLLLLYGECKQLGAFRHLLLLPRSPDAPLQRLQLHNLAVVNQQVDLWPIVLDVPAEQSSPALLLQSSPCQPRSTCSQVEQCEAGALAGTGMAPVAQCVNGSACRPAQLHYAHGRLLNVQGCAQLKLPERAGAVLGCGLYCTRD
jgi:hypothetical protein